ncbi:MAG TPA: phenylalanine--tRNA ligase subunit beta [Patescibacteria group bacterium]|nr:phenylalanine--tRNA ligase subunit beta [Patescibacteria group bacterium]
MKVTLNWLKQYVDFDWSPEVLSERLTMLGIEVEGVQKIGGEFQGIVVAQVLTRDKHPNADKLSLCRVNDGKTERQIVCGAQNFKAGDKVPLILPGATLPPKAGTEPLTIKVGKIRGVESQGMMCSPQELGLAENADGLLILREDAVVGQPFAEYLARAGSDVVYDLEITPNRPDLNSVIGIAREIAAVTGNALRLPEVSENVRGSEQPGRGVADLVSVRIEDSELCPRYTARIIEKIKIAPSPEWLRDTLEKVGVRSINNVVDVTNYVMLETGQPLHAFDYHLLSPAAGQTRPAIVVKRARDGEKFTTLDGQQRTLTDQMLLIADETKPVALAGVMGGQNSEINLNTTDVLIESACFKPQNIRATSKKLELRTESSYRFERGADVGICEWASRRAARLILQTGGGVLANGVVDAYPQPAEPRQISLRNNKVKDLLGIELSVEQIEGYLGQLDLKVVGRKPRPVGAASAGDEPSTFKIPTFRVDLKREVDLIEEVARLYGVDRIPATPPRGAIGSNDFDSIHDQYCEARGILCGLGLFEAQGQTLISGTAAKLAAGEAMVSLANPLSSDMNVLRPSLLPGLLDSLSNNISRKTYDVPLFELGRVFNAAGQGGEERRLAIAITGQKDPVFWSGETRGEKFDIYDLKGILETFFEHYGLRGVVYAGANDDSRFFLESAIVQLGKFQIGRFGQLSPLAARQYDLRDAVFLAELNLDMVLARRNRSKSFRPLPAFPSIRRDIAMVLAEEITHEAVLQVARQTKPSNLESIELFDVFRGKNVPTGQKSMAYAFVYRSSERTLTDAEVNSAHEKLIEQFKAQLNAMVRQ